MAFRRGENSEALPPTHALYVWGETPMHCIAILHSHNKQFTYCMCTLEGKKFKQAHRHNLERQILNTLTRQDLDVTIWPDKTKPWRDKIYSRSNNNSTRRDSALTRIIPRRDKTSTRLYLDAIKPRPDDFSNRASTLFRGLVVRDIHILPFLIYCYLLDDNKLS